MSKLSRIRIVEVKLPSLSLLGILFAFITTNTYSQELKEFGSGEKYTIGEIEVTGVESYNPSTIKVYSGLNQGQVVTIPGETISNSIKKLWGLGLFSDVNIYVTKIEGNVADLEIAIGELPKIGNITFNGLREGKAETILKETSLKKEAKLTENLLTKSKNYIENKYRKKGFLKANVDYITKADTSKPNTQDLLINFDKGKRIKVKKINFKGNEQLRDKKLRKAMKNTKQRNFFNIFKSSKYVEDEFKEDLNSIVEKYKENGYRDARILRDTLYWNSDNTVNVDIDLVEGKKYYFGDIDFLGNSAYDDRYLSRVLGIEKGEPYNGILLEKRIADVTKPDALDITNLYQNNGYLFSRINTVEVGVRKDTVDFEIRINEGKQAYFNKITVTGNQKTNDHVIYRNLRTLPGDLYSKQKLVRTIRELGQLQYFDPENITPNFKNPDPNAGTVDIEYSLVEKGSSQIELQGGYGGGGFVGTLGLRFQNFSLRNIFNKKSYSPLPMGDGQSLSLRLQGSQFYQTYSMSFVEPWLGGKKPYQFSSSLSHTIQYRFNNSTNDVDRNQRFLITGGSIGIAKQLEVPDDYFVLSQSITFQHYNLKNYFIANLFEFGNGYSNNLAYTIALRRNNTAINPIYPTKGSQFEVSAKMTLPYSSFNNVDYANLGDDPEFQTNGQPDAAKIDQERFKWLEYYKLKFKGTWYTEIFKNLVLKTHSEFGFLGAYDQDRGIPPFERFYIGGDGLGGFALDGREVIALRGYPNQSLTSENGGTIYNKFSLELRYPLTLAQTASIYTLAFLEGGASYDGFNEYNPFDLKRSAGVGLRIFMPAFGLLGIDFGHGMDPLPGLSVKNGWETHFIIGQQF